MVEQEYLSIEETARLTGLSTKHIRRSMKKGELLGSNVGGAKRPTYRIAKEDVRVWMEKTRIKCGSAKSARQQLVEEFFG